MKKFKKLGGNEIDNVVDYITKYIKDDPGIPPIYKNSILIKEGVSSNIKISVGCDSKNKKRHSLYAITIMFYNDFKHNGAHVIYKRVKVPRSLISKNKKISQWDDAVQVKDNDIIIDTKNFDLKYIKSQVYNRLYFEAEYSLELANYLNEQLKDKYYIKHENNDDGTIPYNLVEVHLDFNPEIGNNNLSNMLFQTWMGVFSGMGYRVKCKPESFCATNGADFFVK